MPNSAKVIAVALLVTFSGTTFAHDAHDHHRQPNSQTEDDNTFDAKMRSAMEKMDRGMAVAPSGNTDRDFAAMMIPHHQGAVDMARIELEFGKDQVLRRLAQAIIVEQLQEIDVMQRQLNQLPQALGDKNQNPSHSTNDKEH